ncbi:MBOAT family protein [Gemella palaticanis]|uniref:MBOAT family protein n=2 Tax=Gemelliphila palaticanis TaxID=81950 RepID=A0ABX2SYH4_9BACL|nr:MBOAT family protein [Gemella palaticanis]NYS47375.1 MBOAT family protein [Gemella palaticanis]
MPFTTTSFIFLFLPLSILLYYIFSLTKKELLVKTYLVLISSIFYMYSGITMYLYLFIFINIIYLMGKIIEKRKSLGKLILFLSFIILILSYYKYSLYIYKFVETLDFVNITFSSIVVPLGVSFIAFESVSYLVDIYRKDAPSGNYLNTLLFFLFFPKVVSGPIVLWKDFNVQLYNRKTSLNLSFSGVERIMIGFVKKCIIADTLGGTVLKINENAFSTGIDSYTAILGMLLYFIQIYYDFSGYSDIAIGISRIFGFDFKENFNYPYTSTMLSEFWRRWHISLGTWFRNYIYIPLGGNRKNIYLNLFIVFFITGIWHGSTINYVLWGTMHAIFIILEKYSSNFSWYKNIPKFLKWFIVNLFVMLTWVVFMLPELWQVKVYYLSILGLVSGTPYFSYEYFFTTKIILLTLIALIGALIGKLNIVQKLLIFTKENNVGLIIKFVVYLILFILSVMFMINSSYSPFLYFQF